MSGALVGTRVVRKEDDRILTGRGRYVDDIRRQGVLHACFVRSQEPHARLVKVDASTARLMPGVTAVITGADLADSVAELNFGAPLPGLITPSYPAVATAHVRYVGEPVAVVVADTRHRAEDASELVDVEYEPLVVVANVADATADGAVQLYDEVPGNLLYDHEMANGDIDGAFARADRVIEHVVDLHRWAPTPMETRGGVAEYDAATGVLTYQAACQSPHLMRFVVSSALSHPQHLLRVLGPDIGGSFGLKWPVQREDVALCAIARKLEGTVKWIEDRRENLVAGGHGRGHSLSLALAVTNDGRILGMRAEITIDGGAYAVMPSAAVTCGLIRTSLPGPYRVPAFAAHSRVVATNKASHVPLRGPWAIETLAREGALDKAARELGLTPFEIRERNIIPLAEQPVEMASGYLLERCSAHDTFVRAAQLVDYAAEQQQLADARAHGRVVGFGVAVTVEPAPGTPSFFGAVGFPFVDESARARMEPDGHITVFSSQMSHGQSHETTLAQLVADELGVSFSDVHVILSDTQISPFNLVGTGGSRGGTMANGSAALAARALRDKVLNVAGPMLHVAVEDLELAEGAARVTATPEVKVSLADLAMGCYMAPSMMPPGVDLNLDASANYDGEGGGFSQATHCCWIEVDHETGAVTIPRYLVVENCGRMINPAVVEGQIRGAVAMGLGGMLLEETVYDDQGICVTGTFMDYLVPLATDVPVIEIEHVELEDLRSRGVGEGGTIGAAAALANAMNDAVLAAGGRYTSRSPFKPARVLAMLGALPEEA